MMSPSGVAARIERVVALLVLLAVPAIAPMYNVQWSNAYSPIVLLGAGILLAWVLVVWIVGPVSAWLARVGETANLEGILIAGVALQVVSAMITAPVAASDFMHYTYLAQQLASRLPYVDELGRRAWWPPGWPFSFAPFVWALGPTLAATITVNVVLYLIGAYGVRFVARQLFGTPAARIATLLFTIWPARVLMAGLAAKENLLIALVIAGFALCYKALAPPTRYPLLIALAAGVLLGVAASTQPGVFLSLIAIPIIYRSAMPSLGRRAFAARIAAVFAGMALAMAPWMVRNCIVFDGQFCGISTNGGSVFYRANNPNATGVYMSGKDSPISGLSEVERNRVGYELGRQWILAHPLDAAKLTARKWRAYLGGDDYGAYWSVLRGTGGDEDEALRNATEARVALYRFASFVSLAYWVLLAALCARTILGWRPDDAHTRSALPALIYPFVCGALVFGIFESGDRQHIFAVGPLIVLAAAGVAQRRSMRVADTGVAPPAAA